MRVQCRNCRFWCDKKDLNLAKSKLWKECLNTVFGVQQGMRMSFLKRFMSYLYELAADMVQI